MTKLPLPPFMDMTNNNGKDIGHIRIKTCLHKFSQNSIPSGNDPKNFPIFGSIGYINDKKIMDKTFGLPFFRFKKGQKVHLRFTNETGFSFDLHWHGLNTTGDLDGASTPLEFGNATKIGTELTLNFPKITNNSSLLWVHAHPMLISSLFVYSGVYGIVDIIDDISKNVDEIFEYGNNRLILAYQDVDFNSNGSLNNTNLYTEAARSCFGLINGISCVNWYTTETTKYETKFYHKSNKNLMKIDIINGSCSFRTIYIGVCDDYDTIKSFYLIQTDQGLRNPTPIKMISIAPANRISILVNLRKFKNNKANVFFYNFELTEVFNLAPVSNTPVSLLEANIPDLQTNPNPSIYLTPIPALVPVNSNSDPTTLLVYPIVPAISQIFTLLENGNQIPPQAPFTIKKFLKLSLSDMSQKEHCSTIIKNIRKVVFGNENYNKFKNIINTTNFEYSNDINVNYISLLNKNYFYNVPDIQSSSTRNFLLFYDATPQNYNGVEGNPLGATEWINGAVRIMTDMWNSSELDFSYAMMQYNLTPNNYQPSTLPTCLFKIYPTDKKYINYDMISNDGLIVQFFSQAVEYGDITTQPITSATIIFPPTSVPLNINQLKTLINSTYAKTNIIFPEGNKTTLDTIINFDWTFYPYKVSYLTNKTEYVKSIMVKNNNTSPYYIRFLGKWELIQFFGKPISVAMMPMTSTTDVCNCGDNCDCTETNKCSTSCTCWMPNSEKCNVSSSCCKSQIKDQPNSSCCKPQVKDQLQNSCCDNIQKICPKYATTNPVMSPMQFKNNYNMNIQEIYPTYATNNPANPTITYDDKSELIILPNSIYYGFVDGFQSDSIMNFSLQEKSTEKWIYHNLDPQDSHPLHFHLTSGFVDAHDPQNSANLVSLVRDYTSYIYSRDTYSIGPQQSLAFYLKFTNYNSTQGSLNPPIKYLGYMYHCHYMTHHDMNMMGQYYVYVNRSDMF